jgi:ABC-type transport system substrate-binding protein
MIEMGESNQIINLTKDAEAGKLQIYTNAGLQTNETFSALNVGAPPFDDPLARQIVAYGTDRDTLSKAVFAGVFPPAVGPFNENEPAYTATDMPTFDGPRPSSWPTSTRRRTASRSSSPTCSRRNPRCRRSARR